jgi:nucleoside-diphosphate-sugar epimerase
MKIFGKISFVLIIKQKFASNQRLFHRNMSPNLTTLVVGATGATGKHVVQMLLDKGQRVRTIVRSKERMEGMVKGDYGDRLEITEASILDLEQSKLEELTKGCDAIVSCLGHTMDFAGLFGWKHRRLVTTSVKRLTEAVGTQKTKFILMNTVGVANPEGTDDLRPLSERTIIFLVRHIITAHRDNELAALTLHKLGKSGPVEWCTVRPDDLLDGDVSEYEWFDKPKSGLFGANSTTRANVAAAMVELITNDEKWQEWKFKMPVVLNKAAPE